MQSKATNNKELIKIIEECDYKIAEVKNRFVITNCGTELRTEIIRNILFGGNIDWKEVSKTL